MNDTTPVISKVLAITDGTPKMKEIVILKIHIRGVYKPTIKPGILYFNSFITQVAPISPINRPEPKTIARDYTRSPHFLC